ncbi:MAG: T9SS type A sorting domain-containing protein [Bacteroidetes bacterium]|nr:T9SS type A sorting domain-containing protein [Bacteroidota bacterium]
MPKERSFHNFFFVNRSVTILCCVLLFSFPKNSLQAATLTSIATGNWSNPATWNLGYVPLATDNAVINGAFTVTVDGNYTCNNLTVGNGATNSTLQITSAANSLTITGDLLINAGNNGNTYTLDAGPGTINVNGTFSTWGTNGTNNIQLSTGTITFAPLINLNNANKFITFTGAGIINFNAGFSCTRSQANFITVAGCTVNFLGTYTQTTNNITWNATSTAVFIGAVTINNSSRLYLGHVIIYDNAVVTTAGAGQMDIVSNLTLNTNATFTTVKDIPGNVSTVRSIDNITLNAGSIFNLNAPGTYIQLTGNWINNGGTLNGGTYTVRFEGIGNSIGGTSTTIFPDLQLGNTLNDVNYTLSQSITCNNLIFDADNSSRTLTYDATNPSLTVTGNVTMNQPTANAKTNLWDIAGGSSTISGNLIYVGTDNTVDRVCKVNVGSGTLSLSGNITWMANAVESTEEISLSGAGFITFANSLNMPQQSGTFNVTGSGTVNFNSVAAPSFYLNQPNGGAPDAVFNTAFGSTINFKNGFRNASVPVILADGSTAVFTGNGTVTPTAAITFGNVQINAGVTASLAGNISVTTNWTNLGGTFTPGTNTVTFNGTAAQTITKGGGETFYSLTSNATGPITLANNVTITNILTMTAGNYNLNGNTLTLGNAAASTLSRTAGIMYGGFFKRWWLVGTPVTSGSGNYYGLFPVGSSTDYRPVAINSTANPTTAGYVSAKHVDAITVTDIAYVDNEGTAIQRKHDMYDAMNISGLVGGTYGIDVSFTSLSTVGVLTDMKLITYTGGAPGSVGVSAATTGTVSSPTIKRTGLTAAQLQNDWVIGSKNKAATPLRPPYYSRRNGNWNDATPGNATWSRTPGGAGPSCDCTPTADALVFISSTQTVTVTAAASCDYLIIEDAATLNGTANFTVNIDLSTNNTGNFSPTSGTWLVSRNATLGSTSASSTSSSLMTITGNLTIPSSASLTLVSGLTLGGNLSNDGTLAGGASNMAFNGSLKTISGLGTITGSGIITVTNNKTILAGTNLTIAPALALAAATTVTNNGTITLSLSTSNLTGANALTSIWTNAANSVLNAAGAVLATGVLNASASPNTVNYNSGGAQSVKRPSGAGNPYYNLTISNASTKTLTVGSITVTNMLTIQNAAIFNDAGFAVTGVAGLTMSGTSSYVILNNTNPVPSLSGVGAYNITGGTIVFSRGGGQSIRGLNVIPVAYYNVDFSGSGTKTLQGNITVQKDLTISGTTTVLDVNLVAGNNYNITLAGNWSVTATTNGDHLNERAANGTVIFNGTNQQTINWGAFDNTRTFNNLLINNSTPASAILMASPTTVSKQLDLTDGHIVNGSNVLAMGTGGSVALSASPQDSSFVKGQMAYSINTAVTRTYPIGKDNDYRRVDLNVTQSSTATYTIEMINSSAQALGYSAGILGWVSDIRYFNVTQSSNTGFTNAQFRTYYQCTEKNDVVQDLPNLKIAQDNGLGTWQDRGGAAAGALCDGANYAGDILSASFTPFHAGVNKFALANSSGGSNPLPVDLLSFDANPNGNIVDVTWTTASELNSDFFMVQRSKDGTTFENIEKVNGAGNSSSEKNYSTSDYEPYSGISYYRLKQVDNDGKTTFSNMVAVKFQSEMGISVYPNPTIGPFNVSVQAKAGDEVLIVVRDLNGREFYSKIVILHNDKEVFAIDPSGKLAAGVYIVVATSNDTIYEKKIVIK